MGSSIGSRSTGVLCMGQADTKSHDTNAIQSISMEIGACAEPLSVPFLLWTITEPFTGHSKVFHR